MRPDRARIDPPVLSGWKEIASYLGRGVRTVQRYERHLGLPVRRPAGKPRGSVVATKVEIDAWVAASPIREGFQLLRPANEFAFSTWEDIQHRVSEMKRLAKEMTELRAELRNSVRLLRQGIREVRMELSKGKWERRSEDGFHSSKGWLTVLTSDLGRRKAS